MLVEILQRAASDLGRLHTTAPSSAKTVYKSIVLRTTKRQEGLSSHFCGLISTRFRSLHLKKSSSERLPRLLQEIGLH